MPSLVFDNSKVCISFRFCKSKNFHFINFLEQTGSQRAKVLFRPSQNPLGMKFKEKKKPLTREKVLSLIKGELTNAKILYATKEELIEILKNERKQKFLSEFERLNNQTSREKIEEISDFIEFIAQKLDEKQAIVALQTGLSLLNKNRKDCIIEAKNALKEDGIYGEKTKASLYEAYKNYNSRVIKKYILKAVLNNIIFNTKNEVNIDTQKLLNDIKLTLEEKI